MEPYPLGLALALRTPISDQPKGSGFHTVRGGIDPRGHQFRPRFVGVVDLWKDF